MKKKISLYIKDMSLKEFDLIHKAIRTISEDYDSLNETLKAQLRQVFTVERTITSVTQMVQHLNKSTDKKSIFYIIYSQTRSQWFLIWPDATGKFNTDASSLLITDTTSSDDDVIIKRTLHKMSELIEKDSIPFISPLQKLFTVVKKDYQSINDAVDDINQLPSPKSMFYIVFDIAKRYWYLLWLDSNNQLTVENKMMIKQRFYQLSQDRKQYYIEELSKIRSWSSLLSSAKAKQQKNKRYLQSLQQLMAATNPDDDKRLDIDSFKSKLPPQITTKNREKLALLFKAYNQIDSIMRKQQKYQLLCKELLKNPYGTFESRMKTLCQVISCLEPIGQIGDDGKLKKAQEIITLLLPKPLSSQYSEKKIKITNSNSTEWVHIIKDYLLKIKNEEDFCNFIANYPEKHEVKTILSVDRTISRTRHDIKRKLIKTFDSVNWTFLERIEKMNKFQEQLKGKCLSKYLDCFIQLYLIFTEEILNIEECLQQIDEQCQKFASQLEEAQMKLDDELVTLVRNRIKERPGLKTNLQTLMRQQQKSKLRSRQSSTSSSMLGGQDDD